MFVEMLDEGVDYFIRDKRLAGTVRCGLVPIYGEDTAQLVIGGRHCLHCFGQYLADVGRSRFHVAPAGAIRYIKSMFTTGTEHRLLFFCETAPLLPLQLSDRVVCLTFPLIASRL